MKKVLSPHLSIYKLQVTSFLSIAHRISGVLLFFGITVLSNIIIYSYYFEDFLDSIVHKVFISIFGKIIFALWCYAFCYHICSGIRYLFLSKGIGYEKKDITKSAMIVMLSSSVLFIVLLFIVIK